MDRQVLMPAMSEPVRRIETIAPARSFLTPAGRRVLDFGQNIAGRVRITVTGAAGEVVALRHTEVLDVDGELALRPHRLAKATDEYTLAGAGREEWEPRCTFHGFRFVQVDSWPGGADPIDDARAVVCQSDMHRTAAGRHRDTSVLISSDPLVDVEAAISVVSITELHFGVLIAGDNDERARRTDRLAVVEATFDPLPVSVEVARAWGRLATAVALRGGQPRRRHLDLAIAATSVVERVHC